MSRRPPCGRWCPFVLTCRECDWQGGPDDENLDVSAGQESYNDRIPKGDRGMLWGHATSEQSDPPGAFLAVGSTRGSDHNPTAKEST